MKSLTFLVLSLAVFAGSISCGKEVQSLREEIKIVKEENSYLKAENIVLKKELDEVYKKLEEKQSATEAAKAKPESVDPEKAKAAVKVDPKIKEAGKKKPR